MTIEDTLFEDEMLDDEETEEVQPGGDNPYLQDLLNEIRFKGSQKGAQVEIKDGNSAQLRFLMDIPDVLKLPIHSRWVNDEKLRAKLSYTIPCPISYGKKTCPFDDIDDKRTGEKTGRGTNPYFCLLAWDRRDRQIKTFAYKINKSSPVLQLVENWENLGPITEQDFVIKRVGTQLETTYLITALRPTPIDKEITDALKSLFKSNVQDRQAMWKFMKETIAGANYSELLKPGEIKFPKHYYLEENLQDPSSLTDDAYLPE